MIKMVQYFRNEWIIKEHYELSDKPYDLNTIVNTYNKIVNDLKVEILLTTNKF